MRIASIVLLALTYASVPSIAAAPSDKVLVSKTELQQLLDDNKEMRALLTRTTATLRACATAIQALHNEVEQAKKLVCA